MKPILGRAPVFANRRGFTLSELLVVIAIIAVLAGITLPVISAMNLKGRMVKEMQAGRNLTAAYAAAAADQDGVIPPGYDRTVSTLTMPNGTAVGGPPAERYPYRLAPYYQYQIKGTILVGDNANQIDNSDTYMVSCYPALGINYIFFGGDMSATGVLTYPGEAVTRLSNAHSILAFASAAGDGSAVGKAGSTISGYCILTPPSTTGVMWSSAAWKRGAAASTYGNVDARYNGKAVCVFLDGSTRLLSIAELRDMRLWSRNAVEQNNASYTIAISAPTRGR